MKKCNISRYPISLISSCAYTLRTLKVLFISCKESVLFQKLINVRGTQTRKDVYTPTLHMFSSGYVTFE